ncbi:hypothetical protein SEA_EASY2SAY_61 [Mycobacterium phage Easy2Say]|nr:hypothetical protein SEA_EASY2SAY_61 [Mycobacterium phage Easy2Say]
MSFTKTDDDIIAELSEQFFLECQGEKCNREAEYLLWRRHGKRQCGAKVYTCSACLRDTENRWIILLNSGGGCERCAEPFEGHLSDNLRYIKL